MKPMNIVLVGAGAMGSLLGAYLANRGHQLHVLVRRKEQATYLNEHGFRVSGLMEMHEPLASAFTDIAELTSLDPDLVIVATKTWTLSGILDQLRIVHRAGRKILLAQNGLDPEVLAGYQFGHQHTLRMVLNVGGQLVNPGHVETTFVNPPSYLGAMHSDGEDFARDLAADFTEGGFMMAFTKDIRQHTWRKSLLNAAVNSVCALTGQNMQDVSQCPSTRDLIADLLRESLAVARADGYDFGDEFVEQSLAYIANGGLHKPSMLQDVSQDSPTEVHTLSGRIVQLGKQYGIPTPMNQVVTQLILGVEQARHCCTGLRHSRELPDGLVQISSMPQ